MTLEEVSRLRALIAWVSPHTYEPAARAVMRTAFQYDTDWQALNACVRAAIASTESELLRDWLADWLNSAPQAIQEAA